MSVCQVVCAVIVFCCLPLAAHSLQQSVQGACEVLAHHLNAGVQLPRPASKIPLHSFGVMLQRPAFQNTQQL
jgi:hypothetical protein